MADYTPEQIAEANKISAWAAERDRQEAEARRDAYRSAMRPIVTDASWATLRQAVGDVIASTPADDNISIHVVALAAVMDRIAAEPM